MYTEGFESKDNRLLRIVDARDVAEAVLLLYEKPEAEGRYICTAHAIKMRDLVDKLKSLFPHYKYPKRQASCAAYYLCNHGLLFHSISKL